MIELKTRVKHVEKGWFGKTLEFVGTKGLLRVQIENGGEVSINEADLVLATDDENQARLYKEMVALYLKAAERRLVRDWKDGKIPQFGEGDPFTLTYTAPFAPDVLAKIAEQLGFKLPKVRLIHTTGL